PAIVTRLNRAVNDAVKAPDVVERMAGIGMEPLGTSPEQYRKNPARGKRAAGRSHPADRSPGGLKDAG
ncbi:MAG TPA: hypothetical protein VFB08_06790, partial [Burkholderiales bacterium]|nr:hypothetical protein [Burkholderiales bacterium]